MADKTELIRQRMAEKRAALQAKLDALEERTLGVVQETTEAVVQVAESVEDTVQSAKRAVKKTVKKSVRMFDITRQTEEHPWLVMGGAVATGFVASWLIGRGTRRDGRADSHVYYTGAEPYAPSNQAYATPTESALRDSTAETSRPSWLSGLMEAFAPSVDTLKQLAIGTSLAVARDLVLQAVPQQLAGQLNDVFTGLSERLGGEPLPEPDLETQAQAGETQGGESNRPRWEEERQGDQRRHGKRRSHGNGRHREATR